MTGVFDMLGICIFNSSGRFRGVAAIMPELQEALNRLPESQQEEFLKTMNFSDRGRYDE